MYALVQLLHEAYTATDDLKTTFEIVMIDFAKAFDHVNHYIVLRKLENRGVPPLLLRWVHAFLYQRQQRIKIGSTLSEWCYINGGVPQGTKIAILLFLVMIDDLKLICPTIKFVDDVTASESKPLVGPSVMGGALGEVKVWSGDNDMNANPTKTKRLLVNFSKDKGAHHDVEFDSVTIKLNSEAKLLGVIIQDDLKWDNHISFIVSRASQRLHCLRILKRSGFSQSQLVTIYCSRIRSILDYACQVWHPGITQSQSHDIERVQIRAMGIIAPYMPYWEAINNFKLEYLEKRRMTLMKRTYEEIKDENNIIHHLLPPLRESRYNLRNPKPRISAKTRIKRTDNSFINFAIKHFE